MERAAQGTGGSVQKLSGCGTWVHSEWWTWRCWAWGSSRSFPTSTTPWFTLGYTQRSTGEPKAGAVSSTNTTQRKPLHILPSPPSSRSRFPHQFQKSSASRNPVCPGLGTRAQAQQTLQKAQGKEHFCPVLAHLLPPPTLDPSAPEPPFPAMTPLLCSCTVTRPGSRTMRENPIRSTISPF